MLVCRDLFVLCCVLCCIICHIAVLLVVSALAVIFFWRFQYCRVGQLRFVIVLRNRIAQLLFVDGTCYVIAPKYVRWIQHAHARSKRSRHPLYVRIGITAATKSIYRADD